MEAIPQAATIDTPLVRADTGASIGSDFKSALEHYRNDADKLGSVLSRIEHGAGGPGAESLKQLAQLYTHSVSTQVIVRAANQVTGTAKQMMSGQ